jgi:hypothetical protein
MTLEEQYKKETNLEAYELDTLNNGYDNFKYMKWLEAKINYTRCCTEFCFNCSIETKNEIDSKDIVRCDNCGIKR